jgi:hypothetical protein
MNAELVDECKKASDLDHGKNMETQINAKRIQMVIMLNSKDL